MKNIELISRVNLNVSEGYMKKIYQRNVKRISIKDIKYLKNNMGYNLDEDTLYVVEQGLIIYIKNDGFNLYYFKENITDYICKPLHELYKENKLGTKYLNKDSLSSNTISKKHNIDFDVNCWECGSLLDDDGNCSVCGCSKEIF